MYRDKGQRVFTHTLGRHRVGWDRLSDDLNLPASTPELATTARPITPSPTRPMYPPAEPFLTRATSPSITAGFPLSAVRPSSSLGSASAVVEKRVRARLTSVRPDSILSAGSAERAWKVRRASSGTGEEEVGEARTMRRALETAKSGRRGSVSLGSNLGAARREKVSRGEADLIPWRGI